MFPIVLWENLVIDGHNRYDICTRHDIPFDTVNKEFRSRDDVLVWIISTQVSRRNLTPIQLSYYRGLHYRADKRIVTNASGRNQYSDAGDAEPQNEVQPRAGSTARRLALNYNVSRATIERDAKVADAITAIGQASPEAKRNILSGATNITKKQLNELLSASEQDIVETATRIEDGTFTRTSSIGPDSQEGGGSGGRGGDDRDIGDGYTDNSGRDGAVVSPLNVSVSKAMDDFYVVLRRLTKVDDTPELKLALKACIDALSDLFMQM